MTTVAESPLARIVRNLQPAGMRQLLEPKVKRLGYTWEDYQHYSGRILRELEQKGSVVIPDLRVPAEYRQFRAEEGGIFPSEKYAHIETAYRDAWRRFTEARVNARPNQVLLMTSDNNLFPNYGAMKLSKRHNLATTQRYRNLDEVVVLAAHAMAGRLGSVKEGDVLVGLDFQGVQFANRTYRVTHLSDIFRAHLMDQMLPRRFLDGGWVGEVSLYCDTDDIWTMGGEAIVENVPSLSRPGESYVVSLHHIPLVPRNMLRKGVINVTQKAVKESYNFVAEDNCKKPILWTVKYGRNAASIFGRNERKGDEIWQDLHVWFAYLRMMRTAQGQLREELDPGRHFVVLPMVPEPVKGETKTGFRKMYGLRLSETGGAEGGVIVEDRERSIEGGEEKEKLVRYALPYRLVNFDIALHNLVAFTKDTMMPQRPQLVYEQKQLL